MEKLIAALKEFETRNNISAFVIVLSDGSFGLMEFWEEADLGSFKSFEDLLKFLSVTQYALDEQGLCLSPYQIK